MVLWIFFQKIVKGFDSQCNSFGIIEPINRQDKFDAGMMGLLMFQLFSQFAFLFFFHLNMFPGGIFEFFNIDSHGIYIYCGSMIISDGLVVKDSCRSKGFDTMQKRSEEHTSELQSRGHLVCRLLLEK